jgi:hypothetical protein
MTSTQQKLINESRDGNYDEVVKLVKRNDNASSYDEALCRASENGHDRVVEFLLQNVQGAYGNMEINTVKHNRLMCVFPYP